MSNPFRIIYEDEDLVVVSKKEGICVVRGRGSLADIPSVVDMLRDIYQSIFVVHRIDMETSGIVVFAKNPLSHRELSILFEKRKVFKRYLALVWGRISSRLIVDKPIKEFSSGRSAVSDEGKPSTTVIKPLSFFRRFSLIEVFPHTGRRHQIRVHLYSIG
ncbi:MAG: RluA family pseudouridine synthase, partial [Elusimicrobiales bacterium]